MIFRATELAFFGDGPSSRKGGRDEWRERENKAPPGEVHTPVQATRTTKNPDRVRVRHEKD